MGKVVTLRLPRSRKPMSDFIQQFNRLTPGDQAAIRKAIEIVIVSRRIAEAEAARTPPD